MTTEYKRKFILPYRKGSETVKSLLLGTDDFSGIRFENSKYSSREGDLVLNWGNSNTTLDLSRATVLNKPDEVRFASNKLDFFRLMSEVREDLTNPRIPDWTQNQEEVCGWLEDGFTVFARTKLTGNSGEGIVILESMEDFAKNKFSGTTLFTKYVKKKNEYRLHFWKGSVFDIQRKAKRSDVGDVDWRVQNTANGFIFSRNNIGDVPDDVMTQTQRAIDRMSLDFGAIDVIYNRLRNEAYVLEVNTAPGLEGTTLFNYLEKINGL